jgi:hypothetical protein
MPARLGYCLILCRDGPEGQQDRQPRQDPRGPWPDRLAALLASSRRTAGGLELAVGDDRVTRGRLQNLQGRVLRAEGNPLVRPLLGRGQGPRDDRDAGQPQRRTGHRTAGGRAPNSVVRYLCRLGEHDRSSSTSRPRLGGPAIPTCSTGGRPNSGDLLDSGAARVGPTTPTRAPRLPLAPWRLDRLSCCRILCAAERASPSVREGARQRNHE